MVQAISNDLRKRIVKAVDGGLSRNKASKRFDVAVSTVVNLMTHVKETGSIVPKKIGGYCKPELLAHDKQVRDLVTATPDATLAELVEALGSLGILTSRSALDRHFGRISWSFKKNSTCIRARQAGRQGGP